VTTLTEISPANVKLAVANYEKRGSGLDEVLYRLCREHPQHNENKWVRAKVFIIGRTYSSGMERNVEARGGQGSSLGQVADHLWKNHKHLDLLFRHLGAVNEPLSPEKLSTLVRIHGQFLEIIREVTRSARVPRSFASKYMHFHNQAVPIYDSYAASELRTLVRWSDELELFEEPPVADHRYARYAMRFFEFLSQLRQLDSRVNVRLADAFLIQATRGRPASSV
jgi:hypothetical protein